jgi:four helix bundle protein
MFDVMDQAALKQRTKEFALRVMRLSEALPKTISGQTIARQIVRSGTSVGANYRAACRARSRAEFRARIGIVIEEADETAFWLELIVESGLLPESRIVDLAREADELTALLVATSKSLTS